MPGPLTLRKLIQLVRRSRLVDDGSLSEFLNGIRATVAATARDGQTALILTPGELLDGMVGSGLLTRYQANELAVGRSDFWIGGYRILDRLGEGGMGQVFLAERPGQQTRVAVKVLAAQLRSDPEARRRFLGEARAAAAINHPNVVHVFDTDVDHNPPYLVMEYIDGVSLQAAVSRRGAFDAGEAAMVGAQVACGLTRVAEVGLIHRDIKPANLLVNRLGTVKILDLGIARFVADPASRRLNSAVVVGTLDYLAPEQAVDSSCVDARADQYALGATLYFLLAGHPPFPEADLWRKLAMKQATDPAPVHAFRPDVPLGLSGVISRLLARSPAGRYPHPAAVIAALRPWVSPGPRFPSRLFDAGGTQPAPSTSDDLDSMPAPPTRRILLTQATQERLRTSPINPCTHRELPVADASSLLAAGPGCDGGDQGPTASRPTAQTACPSQNGDQTVVFFPNQGSVVTHPPDQ
jgi:serine/threonine-protein kinase